MNRLPRLVFAAAAVAVLATEAAQPRPLPEPPALAEQLRELNAQSRKLYGSAKPEALARNLPVIVDNGDGLTLHRCGRPPETATLHRPVYDDLKAVAHVPLGVFGLLVFRTDRPLDDTARRELDDVCRRIEPVQAALTAQPGSAFGGDLDRQKRILAGSLQFLKDAAQAGTVSAAGLRQFARGMGPELLANADRAAADHLDRLHEQVSRWRSQMTKEEWGQVRVVVIGTQTARADQAATQYYLKLLHEPAVGARVVYAEMIFRGDTPEEKGLELLKTRLLDRMAAEAFFGDDQRLFRDLLADGARKHLAGMKLE
jgi:hypothetical protein